VNEVIRISAIIPAYNREKTIGRAIDSVLAQEYPASEIIVIDDGSKDHTSRVVQDYGEKVRYVYQENEGVAAARNRGVKEAKHEWVAFLDSDDYWLPGHLRRMSYAIKNTEGKAALYFSDIKRPHEEGEVYQWDRCGFTISGENELRQSPEEWAMMRRQPMMFQSSIIRRESFVETGGLPAKLVTREDTFLFYKLCFLYPACAVSGCGAEMSSDGNTKGRLTVALDSSTNTYHECTKLLYKELLRYSDKMKNEHRMTLQRELVLAHLNLGRVLLKRRQVFRAIANVAGAIGISPKFSVDEAIRMVRTYFENRKTGSNCQRDDRGCGRNTNPVAR